MQNKVNRSIYIYFDKSLKKYHTVQDERYKMLTIISK